MAIDISNKEEKQIALTGTQIEETLLQAHLSKDAIEKIEGLKSSASEIDDVVLSVQGGEVIEGYPIDFTTLTSRAGANSIFMNNVQTTVLGKLNTLRIKSDIGSTITAYAYKVTGVAGSYAFELLHIFPSQTLTSAEQTLTYSDDYIVPIGTHIAVKSTSNFYYNTLYPNASKKIGSLIDQHIELAFDFTTKDESESLKDFKESTALSFQTINTNIESIQTIKTLDKSILYKNSFAALTDFNVVNWSATSNKATPSAIGEANYLWLKKRYHLEEIFFTFDMKIFSDTIAVIEFENLSYVQGNGKFKINFATNKLEIYNNISEVESLISSQTIGFTLVSGETYKLIFNRTRGWDISFSIVNYNTSEISTVSYLNGVSASLSNQNRMMDSLKIYQQSGASFISVSNLLITSVKNPLVMLMGDSITEGIYFTTSTYNNRYPILLKNKLNGNLIVSARGGSNITEVADKVTTEVQFVKPIFVMLTIGTNIGLTETNLTAVVTTIESYGSKVIINHVPNRADGSHVSTNLVIDTVCKNTTAILGAKFDIPTSISGNPSNSYITSLYSDTGVHPNEQGQIAMYNRLLLDCPYLF